MRSDCRRNGAANFDLHLSFWEIFQAIVILVLDMVPESLFCDGDEPIDNDAAVAVDDVATTSKAIDASGAAALTTDESPVESMQPAMVVMQQEDLVSGELNGEPKDDEKQTDDATSKQDESAPAIVLQPLELPPSWWTAFVVPPVDDVTKAWLRTFEGDATTHANNLWALRVSGYSTLPCSLL